MFDLNKILREEYSKKDAQTMTQTLIEMIEEIMEDPPDLSTPIKEGANPKTRTYHISEIPMIPISELGWANADDDAMADDPNIPPSQRATLEQYLRNIPGTGFADKLNAVSNIMKEGIGSLPKEDPRIFIRQAMAFLVFYKTLTMAITNFNASAAGFNFEAFLAALMDGKQIPASGANTIADITAMVDDERIPISLKLYAERGLEVGGSFVDLSNDMLEPNPEWTAWVESNPQFEGGAMRYIACTKELEGEGVEQEGSIKFYEFDLTRANLFDVLSTTGKGRSCIQSNTLFMKAVTEYMETGIETDDLRWAMALPAKKETGDSAELGSEWATYLDNNIDLFATLESEQIPRVRDTLVKLYVDTIETTQSALILASLGALKMQLAIALNPSPSGGEIKQAHALRDTVVVPLFKRFKADVIKTRDLRARALDEMTWLTGPHVAAWYNTLTPELKALAIKNTRGYLGRYHWVIPREATKKLGGGQPFATLQIGAKSVMEVLETARGELMDEVFDIFDQMARMSAKLNSFFARGLKEPAEAEAGAEAGEEAAGKVRQVAGIAE